MSRLLKLFKPNPCGLGATDIRRWISNIFQQTSTYKRRSSLPLVCVNSCFEPTTLVTQVIEYLMGGAYKSSYTKKSFRSSYQKIRGSFAASKCGGTYKSRHMNGLNHSVWAGRNQVWRELTRYQEYLLCLNFFFNISNFNLRLVLLLFHRKCRLNFFINYVVTNVLLRAHHARVAAVVV